MNWSSFLGSLWETVLDGLFWLCQFAFSWINLPQFPSSLSGSINDFLNLIFDNLSLIGFFVRPITLQIVIPILIILINFELLYKLVIWIIRKIPILGVK